VQDRESVSPQENTGNHKAFARIEGVVWRLFDPALKFFVPKKRSPGNQNLDIYYVQVSTDYSSELYHIMTLIPSPFFIKPGYYNKFAIS